MSETEYDVVVIGAGPAGEVAAARLAERGRKVAIVEQDLVGGECSFYACMPSKALLRPAEALEEVERIPGAAAAVTGSLDVAAVLERRDEVIHDLDDSGQVPWLEDQGITLLRGHGRLDGEKRVRVGDDVLTVREAVILANGSGATVPPIPGLREAGPWTNREVTTAHAVPERLLILGGGVVGVEMAQAYASLGAKVSLVEGAPRLIPRNEPFASEDVATGLRERGVELHLDVKATEVRRAGESGPVTLVLDDGTELEGDELLCAVGRVPHTGDLGLDTVGLEPGEHVEVGDDLRVEGKPWLLAIGDVNGRVLLTHMGKYQAHIATEVLDGSEMRVRIDGPASPQVIFTDPQVAAVGLTADRAAEQGISTVVVEVPTSGTAGASFYGRNAPGTSRFVFDRDREILVGATFTGAEVADFVQAATIAVAGEVPVARLWDAVAPFPTRSEIWLKLLEAYEREIREA